MNQTAPQNHRVASWDVEHMPIEQFTQIFTQAIGDVDDIGFLFTGMKYRVMKLARGYDVDRITELFIGLKQLREGLIADERLGSDTAAAELKPLVNVLEYTAAHLRYEMEQIAELAQWRNETAAYASYGDPDYPQPPSFMTGW